MYIFRPAVRQQVGAVFICSLFRRVFPPFLYLGVISGYQNFRHRQSPVHGRPGIVGRVQGKFPVPRKGIGIPAGAHEHIFEDFFRAQNVGEESGTGLGLSIAKKIVHAHHGKIWFESPYEDGKSGTKFAVVIPRDLATAEMKHEEWESSQVGA